MMASKPTFYFYSSSTSHLSIALPCLDGSDPLVTVHDLRRELLHRQPLALPLLGHTTGSLGTPESDKDGDRAVRQGSCLGLPHSKMQREGSGYTAPINEGVYIWKDLQLFLERFHPPELPYHRQ